MTKCELDTKTGSFRTKNKATHEQWLQALLNALYQPKISRPLKALSHFRYSMDSLMSINNSKSPNTKFHRQNTLPVVPVTSTNITHLQRRESFLDRIKRLRNQNRSLDTALNRTSTLSLNSRFYCDNNNLQQVNNLRRRVSINKASDIESEISVENPHYLPVGNPAPCLDDQENYAKFISENDKIYERLRETIDQKKDILDDEEYTYLVHQGTSPKTNSQKLIEDDKYERIREPIDENKNIVLDDEHYTYLVQEGVSPKTEDFIGLMPEDEKYERIRESIDKNKNIIVDDEQYSYLVQKGERPEIGVDLIEPTGRVNEVEYYCTYGENKSDKPIQVIYSHTLDHNLPDLPPRKRGDTIEELSVATMEETCMDEKKDDKKNGFLNKFLHKEEGKKVKRKKSFFHGLFKHKPKKESQKRRESEDSGGYEYVTSGANPYEYVTANVSTDPSSQQFSSNSGSLQNLEGGAPTTNKKLYGAREVLSQETLQELNQKLKPTQRKYDGNLDQDSELYEFIPVNTNITDECPGLPPRSRDSRPHSPWHDVPTNNTPYSKPPSLRSENIISPYDYNPIVPVIIDKKIPQIITTDTESELDANKSIDTSLLYTEVLKKAKRSPKIPPKVKPKPRKINIDLSVKELIQKFNGSDNCLNIGDVTICRRQIGSESDIQLRKDKCDECVQFGENRHSEDLNQLLNELSKITTAPLVQPRAINSLVLHGEKEELMQHHRSYPISDDEFLAIVPIRRRRHSEPDYDVPRSHKSLDLNNPPSIIPPETPPKPSRDLTLRPISGRIDSQSTLIRDSIEPPSLTWSWSMTPDSLEICSEISNYQRLMKFNEDNHKFSRIKENNNNIIDNGFFDSLEQSTLF